jgi:hypothetical protein
MTENPPAFARAFPSIESGITLRDYFAAAALTGIVANHNNDYLKPPEWAHDSYAMLAEREKETP